MAAARRAGSPDLKMPEPTNTPSQPSCIIRAASAGVAMPPAAKLTTGRRPRSATSRTSSSGAPISLAKAGSSSLVMLVARRICEHRAHVEDGLRRHRRYQPRPWCGSWPRLRRGDGAPHRGHAHRTRTGSETGACRCGTRCRRASALRSRRCSRCRGFDDLRLDEVADASLGHDRDGDGRLDAAIRSGSLMRATPPSRRMSAGTRSSAMTATAPASSAIRACSA